MKLRTFQKKTGAECAFGTQNQKQIRLTTYYPKKGTTHHSMAKRMHSAQETFVFSAPLAFQKSTEPIEAPTPPPTKDSGRHVRMRAMGTEEPFRGCFRQGTRKNDLANLRSNNQKHLPPIKDTQKDSECISEPEKGEIRGVCKYFRDADFSQQKIHIFLTLIRDSSATI